MLMGELRFHTPATHLFLKDFTEILCPRRFVFQASTNQ